MTLKVLTLSSSGLKNVIKEGNDFIFAFGNHQIQMNSISAEFASPIVSRLHLSDPTINSICIDLPSTSDISIDTFNFDEIITDEIISTFYNVFNGFETTINEDQNIKIRILAILIGNEELFHQINKLFPIDINISNVDRYITELRMFEYLSHIASESDFNFFSILDFISSNFYLIEKEKLKKIPKKILLSIMNNEHLKVESEDSIFEFIRSIFEQENDDELKINFYEKICLQNLSEESFKKFLSDLDSGEVTGNIWQNICYRFIYTKTLLINNNNNINNSKQYSQQSVISILFDGVKSHAFNGIIDMMTQECGGNVDKKDIVKITASSRKRSDVDAFYAANLHDVGTYFYSLNEENSWLKYDFKDRKIMPSHYSIRSYPSSKNSEHLISWVIEGSNTDNVDDWKILDSRHSCGFLNNRSASHTFEIQQSLKPDEYYRYIRLRQIGYNASNTYHLSLSSLEFFGKII